MAEPKTRSGFVALAGRPNAGKSTLVNRLVGERIAIVTDKPQTTRREIRGIHTVGDRQLVLVDLPGVQRPRDMMTERMQSRVLHAIDEGDGVLFMLNAEQKIGPGDRFIAGLMAKSTVPVITAVNKIDRLDKGRMLPVLDAAAELAPGELYPISALTGEGLDALMEALLGFLPEGPFYYDPSDRTDLPESVRLAETVREQIVLRMRQEVPHAVEVEVLEIEHRQAAAGPITAIMANLWVESDSQKAILLGKGGRMIKAIGTAARKEIEASLGERVHLDLTVAVRKAWRGDEGLLDRLGIN